MAPRLPPHGTTKRYRIEVKDGKTCAKCRAANAAESRARRERKATEPASSNVTDLHAFAGRKPAPELTTPATTSEPVVNPGASAGPTNGADHEPGRLERTLIADLERIAPADQVPFHDFLADMAKEITRDLDVPDRVTGSDRTAARKQVFEVVKFMTKGGAADGAETALDLFLSDNEIGSGIPGLP